MKLIACSIYSNQELIKKIEDLSSFGYFYRSNISEHIAFGSRLCVQRVKNDEKTSVTINEDFPYIFHVYRCEKYNIFVISVTDKEYPERIAFEMMKLVSMEPSKIETIFSTYKDPKNADKILKTQIQLEETRLVMHKNIDQILQRGEKLEDLMARSSDLSASSILFYNKSKKLNQCCKYY